MSQTANPYLTKFLRQRLPQLGLDYDEHGSYVLEIADDNKDRRSEDDHEQKVKEALTDCLTLLTVSCDASNDKKTWERFKKDVLKHMRFDEQCELGIIAPPDGVEEEEGEEEGDEGADQVGALDTTSAALAVDDNDGKVKDKNHALNKCLKKRLPQLGLDYDTYGQAIREIVDGIPLDSGDNNTSEELDEVLSNAIASMSQSSKTHSEDDTKAWKKLHKEILKSIKTDLERRASEGTTDVAEGDVMELFADELKEFMVDPDDDVVDFDIDNERRASLSVNLMAAVTQKMFQTDLGIEEEEEGGGDGEKEKGPTEQEVALNKKLAWLRGLNAPKEATSDGGGGTDDEDGIKPPESPPPEEEPPARPKSSRSHKSRTSKYHGDDDDTKSTKSTKSSRSSKSNKSGGSKKKKGEKEKKKK